MEEDNEALLFYQTPMKESIIFFFFFFFIGQKPWKEKKPELTQSQSQLASQINESVKLFFLDLQERKI